MEFNFVDSASCKKSFFVLNFNSKNLRELKAQIRQNRPSEISLGFEAESLNLTQKLYGDSAKQSLAIQRANCRLLIKKYHYIKRVLAVLRRKKVDFNGTFYVKNLKGKLNNNDFMLKSMLAVSCKKFGERLELAYDAACDFMDLESNMYDMCGFKDDRCRKDRDRGVERGNACCPGYCKVRVDCAPCPDKNISCKLFMCDYVKNLGYVFSPFSLAVLRLNYLPLDMLLCYSCHFRAKGEVLSKLRKFRWLSFALLALALFAIIIMCL